MKTHRFRSIVASIASLGLLFCGFPVHANDEDDAKDLIVLGRVFDNVLKHDMVFVQDPHLTAALNGVLERVTAANGQFSVEFEVKVINSLLPNAFASPSGSIYVTTGMLDSLKSPEELAFVLAHQIAHVENLSTWEEFEKVRGKHARIMWATYIAMAAVTVVTAGAMASAAGALSSAGVSTASAAGQAALATVGGVSAALTNVENSKVRFAKSGVSTEQAYHPVFSPAMFAAMNMGIYEGGGEEKEAECNEMSLELLANAGIDNIDAEFYAKRLGGMAAEVRTHMTTYTKQQAIDRELQLAEAEK